MRLQYIMLNALIAIVLSICGCGGSDTELTGDESSAATVPYICLETNEVFSLQPQHETPARNPKTGKSSLMPAYQDEETKEWKPIDLPDRTIR